MRVAHLLFPLSVVPLLACEPGDDPSASSDPVSPAVPGPSLGATVLKLPFNFFFLQDFDRDLSATVGLVSPVSDLGTEPDCGGSGPEVYDGGGIERIVATPSGAFHLRDQMHNATFVLYEGAPNDVCELATHPVIARGPVNFHFAIKDLVNGSALLQINITGNLELTSGGQAHFVSIANAIFYPDGSFAIHVDKLELRHRT
jgi:hypothetical protein